jgi:DNA polymerase-3 subunit delta
LFAARRIVEIRLASPRPGDGSQVIANLAERPDADRLLVVGVSAKLDSSAQRSKWVKAIEQHGVRIDVWPVERAELPRWIAERAASLDLSLDPPAAELLADRVEGNLLAADQELRKLALTAPGRIGEDTILEAVANSARFDVFRLTDEIEAGDARRALRALYALKAEGVAPALVSWALNREIALLTRLKFAVGNRENVGNAMARHGVWRRRQPAVKLALDRYTWPELNELMARAAKLDDTIKGVERGRPWETLTSLVLAMLDTRRLGVRPAA